ncbi:hypothetical protein BU23DRAFT_663049 [Bimuria novae-zelandiae CBS 107.79]|uniref:Ankyrin n=1 Tax=Bimuria novae-zelandiae CBS 107.79 TaxID=1447943 RepID=A0A6A5UMM6_9PLEO|nr:hypothetical protein BU23DRAFT_663049 [Bimuria novae-zelandiae CBS 107.79]
MDIARQNALYSEEEQWHDDFRAFTILHRLGLYVKATIEGHGDNLPYKKGRPYLDYACRSTCQNEFFPYQSSRGREPDIIEFLLEHGADPNEKFEGGSTWQKALSDIDIADVQCGPIYWAAFVKLLVQHGADLREPVTIMRYDSSGARYRRKIPFKGRASGAIRFLVTEADEPLTNEERTHILDLAREIEELKKLTSKVKTNWLAHLRSKEKRQWLKSKKEVHRRKFRKTKDLIGV